MDAYEPKHVKLWAHPDSYFGAVWPATYVFLSRNRDSDCLTESNFAKAMEMIGGESDTVSVVRESHWACGWIEWIAIHQDDSAALEAADDIVEWLAAYPVLDESDFCEREHESANDIWRDCYNSAERIAYIREHRWQFEFASFADLYACVRGEYFAGYASELIG